MAIEKMRLEGSMIFHKIIMKGIVKDRRFEIVRISAPFPSHNHHGEYYLYLDLIPCEKGDIEVVNESNKEMLKLFWKTKKEQRKERWRYQAYRNTERDRITRRDDKFNKQRCMYDNSEQIGLTK